MPNKFTTKAKQNIVQRYQSGETAQALCLELSIPKSTFYYWARLYHVQVTPTGVIVTPKKFYHILNVFSVIPLLKNFVRASPTFSPKVPRISKGTGKESQGS